MQVRLTQGDPSWVILRKSMMARETVVHDSMRLGIGSQSKYLALWCIILRESQIPERRLD